MKVLIETYRDWEIFFDTDKEDFYCVSVEYDTQQNKKSFASTKKFIDDYIKSNFEFRPVQIEKQESIYGKRKAVTLIGIRKDGAFVVEFPDGTKKQLSNWDEKEYFLVNPENEPIHRQILELIAQRKQIEAQIKETEAKLVKVFVSDYRKTLVLP